MEAYYKKTGHCSSFTEQIALNGFDCNDLYKVPVSPSELLIYYCGRFKL
jgi:hypothetical protein